jgi:hypothetical protein
LDRNATGKRRTYVTILRQSPQSMGQKSHTNERFSSDRGNKTTVPQTSQASNSGGFRRPANSLALADAGPFEIYAEQLPVSFGNAGIGRGNRTLLLLSSPAGEVDPVVGHGTPPCLDAQA